MEDDLDACWWPGTVLGPVARRAGKGGPGIKVRGGMGQITGTVSTGAKLFCMGQWWYRHYRGEHGSGEMTQVKSACIQA